MWTLGPNKILSSATGPVGDIRLSPIVCGAPHHVLEWCAVFLTAGTSEDVFAGGLYGAMITGGLQIMLFSGRCCSLGLSSAESRYLRALSEFGGVS
jgi:hypothetical protein